MIKNKPHKLAVLVMAVFSLAACESILNPSFMPKGYGEPNKSYKSRPAKMADPVGYRYSLEAGENPWQLYQDIAVDLIQQMQGTGYLTPDTPIFLASPDGNDAFMMTLDHSMREALRADNYNVDSLPSDTNLKLAIAKNAVLEDKISGVMGDVDTIYVYGQTTGDPQLIATSSYPFTVQDVAAPVDEDEWYDSLWESVTDVTSTTVEALPWN